MDISDYGLDPMMIPENINGFIDCKHNTEPGCAVKAAIENGELPLERWNSYINLKRQAKFSDDKAGICVKSSKGTRSLL